jgi:hypothetical protein
MVLLQERLVICYASEAVVGVEEEELKAGHEPVPMVTVIASSITSLRPVFMGVTSDSRAIFAW